MVHNHLHEGCVGGQPRLHDALHQLLAGELLVLILQLVQDAQLLQHGEQLVLLVIHSQIDDLQAASRASGRLIQQPLSDVPSMAAAGACSMSQLQTLSKFQAAAALIQYWLTS